MICISKSTVRIFLFFSLILNGFLGYGQSLEEVYNSTFEDYISNGGFDYDKAYDDKVNFSELEEIISHTAYETLSEKAKKAFLINAYNALVIVSIVNNYPVISVQDIPRFFTRKYNIGGESFSLDDIENKLLDTKADPRLHMVLICGAASCPPLNPTSFTEKGLNEQIAKASKNSISSPQIAKENNGQLQLSKIFRWYVHDFGNVRNFINVHSPQPYPADINIAYQDYDWSLNLPPGKNIDPLSGQKNKYFTSYLYGKDQYEVSVFNNYFTQHENNVVRSNFFTSFLTFTYGLNRKVNFSLSAKLRSVTVGPSNLIDRFEALDFSNDGPLFLDGEQIGFRKIGVSALIPRIKYQPFSSFPNLSFQHGIAIPLNFSEQGGFLDWGSPSLYNDAFYDYELGSKVSLFFQLSAYLENIGSSLFRSSDGYYQLSFPMTFIYQYFPSKNTTLYILTNAAPQWGFSVSQDGDKVDTINDSYGQLGIGVKQFITDRLQLELLYTKFFSSKENSPAATYNLGFRYFGW